MEEDEGMSCSILVSEVELREDSATEGSLEPQLSGKKLFADILKYGAKLDRERK